MDCTAMSAGFNGVTSAEVWRGSRRYWSSSVTSALLPLCSHLGELEGFISTYLAHRAAGISYSGAPLQRSSVMNWARPPLPPAGRFHRREGAPAHRRSDPLRRSPRFSACYLTSQCSDELGSRCSHRPRLRRSIPRVHLGAEFPPRPRPKSIDAVTTVDVEDVTGDE